MDWNGSWFGLAIGLLFVGLVVGFLGARKLMKHELKKNPPINENMIRAMFMSMGRKPSEAQIRAVIQNMKNSQ
ncbi:MAG: YneF family protein [Bacilli bacterium]|nr:YneF family protein [Bacilli bacterium]